LLLGLVLGFLFGLSIHLFNGEFSVSREINLFISYALSLDKRSSILWDRDELEHLFNSSAYFNPCFTAEKSYSGINYLESSTNQEQLGIHFLSDVI
jgi:hypothetical protein